MRKIGLAEGLAYPLGKLVQLLGACALRKIGLAEGLAYLLGKPAQLLRVCLKLG